MGSPRKYLWDVLVNGALASPVVPIGLRTRVLRMLGVQVGSGVRVRHHVHLTSSKLTLGDGSYVNVGAVIQNTAPVTLGREVAVAPNVVITTIGHDLSNPARRQGEPHHGPVDIADGVWIGAAAVVLPGVEIGAGAMIAAGAVVTTDCAPHRLHAGVPARPVKALPGAEIDTLADVRPRHVTPTFRRPANAKQSSVQSG